MKHLATITILSATVPLAGCSDPNHLLFSQADDYQKTVVKGVLAPAYESGPATEMQKAAVRDSIVAHEQFLNQWRSQYEGK